MTRQEDVVVSDIVSDKGWGTAPYPYTDVCCLSVEWEQKRVDTVGPHC
jgi:hypothetical protein